MSTMTPVAAVPSATERPGSGAVSEGPAPQRRRRWTTLMAALKSERTRQLLRRRAVAAWMNLLIVAAAAITFVCAGLLGEQPWPLPGSRAAGILKLFVLWCMAFLPGWLYIRFLSMRAKALWGEYVLTLHRLGWDRPEHLPEPPVSSDFHPRWNRARSAAARQTARPGAGEPESPRPDSARRSVAEQGLTHEDPDPENIYRQKFEAYYGRQLTPDRRQGLQDSGQDFYVRVESLFPIFLATAVFSTGWAAVLWDTGFLTAPGGVFDALKYGFLGAYAFVVSMLIRRFFQTDLRPSAYASAVLRVMLVLLLVSVVHQVLPASSTALVRGELALAFLIGFFPLVGLSFLQQVVSKVFGAVLPALTSEYPLDQLDGFSLWYEARLTEEGVEDMQNLTTMNLVDVVLHTRVPPGRLVDWIDQAFLLIHLEPATRDDLKLARQGGTPKDCVEGAKARVALRRVGIRTATDLLRAFSVQEKPADCRPGERRFQLPTLAVPPLPKEQLELLVGVLAAEPGLAPVWNWQLNGVLEHSSAAAGRDSSGCGRSDVA